MVVMVKHTFVNPFKSWLIHTGLDSKLVTSFRLAESGSGEKPEVPYMVGPRISMLENMFCKQDGAKIITKPPISA